VLLFQEHLITTQKVVLRASIVYIGCFNVCAWPEHPYCFGYISELFRQGSELIGFQSVSLQKHIIFGAVGVDSCSSSASQALEFRYIVCFRHDVGTRIRDWVYILCCSLCGVLWRFVAFCGVVWRLRGQYVFLYKNLPAA